MKKRISITVDDDVWNWWKQRPGVNKSDLINDMLIEEMKYRKFVDETD